MKPNYTRSALILIDMENGFVDHRGGHCIKGAQATVPACAHALDLARSKGITVRADASVPVALGLSELDLCVILGNLFDNAIEASLALPQDRRLIRVYIDMKGEQLYISFTNFTAGKKRSKTGGRFRTTKGEGHGFGLVRIDTVVERLGGWLSRNSEDGAFTTEILLPAG